MKIRIIDVFSEQGTLRVKFSSTFGNGTAFWHGAKPSIGEDLDVEFELDEVFFWKKNIDLSSDTTPKIIANDGTYTITGELINDTDNYAMLKLGDSIILVELNQPISHNVGFADVRTTAIHFYPTNI